MKTLSVYLFLTVCIIVILLQAFHPLWSGHIIFDLFAFRDRALGNFVNNEYQPGALLFFNLLSPFAAQSLDVFKVALFTANIILIYISAIFIQKITRPENNIIFALLLLFIGPIILFRFEILVVTLVIVSIYFFKKENIIASAMFLALSIMVKVYPLIYLPYFLISLYRKGGIKSATHYLLVFIITSLTFLVFFMLLFRFNFNQLTYSLNYHVLKPVGVEGFWTSLVSLFQLISTGSPPTLEAKYLTWGISEQSLILPMWFFNNFWIFILLLSYLFYIRKKDYKFNPVFLLEITLVTVLFSKLSSPQYLIWFFALIPLINIEKFISNTRLCLVLIISLLVAFLTQYIYPLNYSEFLSFFSGSRNFFLFYIFVTKNLLLLISLYLLLTLKGE